MNPEVAIDLFKSTVIFALWVVAPFLVVLLVVGLLSSLFQSVTSMQEQTLSFAPKTAGFRRPVAAARPLVAAHASPSSPSRSSRAWRRWRIEPGLIYVVEFQPALNARLLTCGRGALTPQCGDGEGATLAG